MNEYLVAVETLKSTAQLAQKPVEGFNKKDYLSMFEQRYQSLLPAFDGIENLYLSVKEPEEMLSNMALAYTEASLALLEDLPKRKREQLKMDMNMNLAVYVYPAILYYKGESSKALCDALQSAWKEAFPESNVTPAEIEQIESGFHRKFCYITTAVCQTLGKSDDCYELNLLRDYRDGYLSARKDGQEMIHLYYDVAPSIVKHIEQRSNQKEIYQDVWEHYLQPCIQLIEQGENEDCALLYKTMVEDLKEKYFYLEQ